MKNFLKLKWRYALITIFAIFSVIIFSIYLYIRIHDSDGSFLYTNDGTWIKSREPLVLEVRSIAPDSTMFRTIIDIHSIPNEAVLHFKAFRAATIFFDEQCIYRNESFLEWNKTIQVNLSPYLILGHHVMTIEVKNNNGPPALTAVCHELGIKTSEDWEFSKDGKQWGRALSADTIIPPGIYYQFNRTDKAFLSNLSIYIFVLITIPILLNPKISRKLPQPIRTVVSPADMTKWIILFAYFILAINNILKLPIYMGMDHRGHLAYIQYIVENISLPLAKDGWSMFEPPLFYSISAFIYMILAKFISVEIILKVLRIIPLLCGAIQIEVCARALKTVYPDRQDLQIFGILVGGLLPVNTYISQFISTEPLAGCLMAIAVLISLKIINSNTDLNKPSLVILLGIFLGFALISKITAFLLIPPIIVCILMAGHRSSSGIRQVLILTTKNSSIVLGIAFIISGWFFIRNYFELGHFIIGIRGGGFSSGFSNWWQDPGYRTFSQLMWSGQSVFQPVYSGVFSIWDSLYTSLWCDSALSGKSIYTLRPPWNYDLMLSSVLFSVVPSAAIILGILTIFKTGINRKQFCSVLFSICCVFIFIAAIFYQYLLVPIYSIAKAKYLLGILPCIAILSAAGFGCILKRQVSLLKSILLSLLVCWGISAYSSYFVWNISDELKITDHFKLANELMQKGRFIEAVDQYVDIQQISPGAVPMDSQLIKALYSNVQLAVKDNNLVRALHLQKKLMDLQLDLPDNYYNTACIYSLMGNTEEAILFLKKAVEKGFHNWNLIRNDPDLINIRSTSFYKMLSQKSDN